MVENGTKPWWMSTTIQGIFVMVLGIVISKSHTTVSTDDLQSVVGVVCEAVGMILGVWGRIKANKVIA